MRHLHGVHCRRLHKYYTLRNVTLAVVLLVVLWNEYLSHSFSRLLWSNLYSHGSADDELRLLFVADPQLVGLQDESKNIGFITRWDSDIYMRRSFSRAFAHIQPDVVVYLGDLIDEGSKAKPDEYASYMQRFKSVFSVPGNVKEVYIPGDNDIGGEGGDFKHAWKIERFNENFFHLNQQHLPHTLQEAKFVDFFRLNWNDNERYESARETVKAMAGHSKGLFRIVLNHMGILSRNKFSFYEASIITCKDCLVNPKETGGQSWRGSAMSVTGHNVFTFNLNDKHSLTEITVPTCSYRMGMPKMGYGAAVIDKDGVMRYSVLWSPHRYFQLYLYVVLLVIVTVIWIPLLILRLLSRRHFRGLLPR